ncbi:type II secretion system F family protein [Orbus wheelerorum]|uniref:type II secretion system F family protein n=1 Tax=Orbus wheelerorum TaxID=3074111 RepID=UPI00370D9E2D
MIFIFALVLIMAALISLFSLRRKHERLHVFNKTKITKKPFPSQLRNRNSEDKESLWKNANASLINKIIINYSLIINNSTNKLKLAGIMTFGMVFALVINYLYLNLNAYLVLSFSFIATVIIVLSIKKRRLKKNFYNSFPEALLIITGIVSSGGSVSVGFYECSTKLEGPVATAMKEICNRLDMGENSHNVLLNSYYRLPFPEYYFFILTVMVNIDSGGELKEVLSRLSKMLTNNRILNKVRDSKTAELRMSVIILAAIPIGFVLLLKLISPDNYQYLMETKIGNYILYYTSISVIFGIFFIRRMINKAL